MLCLPLLTSSNIYTSGSVMGLMSDKTHSVTVEDIVCTTPLPIMVKKFGCP